MSERLVPEQSETFSPLVFPSRWLRPWLFVIVIVASSVAFQTAAIPRRGIWGDEVVRLQIIAGGAIPAETLSYNAVPLKAVFRMMKVYPSYQPLYYLLQNRILHVTKAFTDLNLKLVNIYISALSTVGIFAWGRRFLRPMAAILATIFFAFNGWGLMHNLQIREYPLLLCLLIWNAYFYQRICENHLSRRQLIFFVMGHAFSGACALYTSTWALFPMLPQILTAWLGRENRLRRFLVLGSSFLLMGVVWTPWIAATFVLNYDKTFQVIYDHAPPTIALLGERMAIGFCSLFAYESPHVHIFFHPVCLALLILVLFAIGQITINFIAAGPSRRLLVGWCAIFLSFQVFYFFYAQPLSTWPRYFILYLPAFALLLAEPFDRIDRRLLQTRTRDLWATAVLSCGILYSFNQASAYWNNPLNDQSMDLREIGRTVMKHSGPHDLLFANSSIVSQGIGFYLPPNSIRRVAWRNWSTYFGRPGVENIWLILIPNKGEAPPVGEILSTARAHGFTVAYEKKSNSLWVVRLEAISYL